MRKIDKLIGTKVGRLLIIEFDNIYKNKKYIKVLCKCDCGNIKSYYSHNITSGSTTSCGCFAREVSKELKTTHGMYGTVENRTWSSMIQRCFNKTDQHYEDYGGRGITVYDRWKDSFENFYEDMGPRPSDEHSLDRIDNDGNYEPSNCRWATKHQQSQNQRTTKFNEVIVNEIRIKYRNGKYTQQELADFYGCCQQTISSIVTKKIWANI